MATSPVHFGMGLEPNYALAERHLALLDEESESFTFATFTDSKEKKNPDTAARILHGTLEERWDELVRLNYMGAGIFVVVNETNGKGAKNENIIRIRAVWQEADRGDEPKLPVEPHIIIETSPGKHHRYILVSDAPVGEFESVQQRLVDDYGSDPSAKDRRRVLRLAGFYHQKDRANPHLVRIVHESCEAPIPWATVKQIFPPVERRAVPVDHLPAIGTPLVNPAEIASALTKLNADMQYSQWLIIGMALHATGAGREAFDLWDKWSSKGALYKRGECAYRWGTFNRKRARRVTINTLYQRAYQCGWDGEIQTDPEVLPLVDVQRRRMFAAFSERHAVTMINGKAIVVYREFDQDVKRMTTRFSTRGDIATKFEPEKLPFVAKNKNGKTIIKYKPIVPIWMQSRLRKTFEQLIFRPVPRLVSGSVTLPDDDVLNLYQGLAITPNAGDCSLILRHILEVWCSGNTQAESYVLNWLARMFQKPNERGHTVIVLRSGEGTGKNIIVDMLVQALGEHAYVAVKPEELTGRFNDHLATSVLVFANEAVWGGDKQQEGSLKSLITDEDLPIERKYIPRFRVRNCCHLIMASNNDWVAPIGLDDRRFVVLDANEDRKDDTSYFAALAKQCKNGGAEALVHYLLERDISAFEPRILPDLGTNQATKFDAKVRTADSITQWWVTCLTDGEICAEESEELDGMYSAKVVRKIVNLVPEWENGPVEIERTRVRESYRQWAQNHRRHIEHETSVGKRLSAVAYAEAFRPRTSGPGRPWFYRFPSLEECRNAFDAVMKQPGPWVV